MDTPGMLATEETVEVTQRPQVCHHTDLAVHGHVDDTYPLAPGDKIETSCVGGHAHDIIILVQELQLSAQQSLQRNICGRQPHQQFLIHQNK